MDYTFGNVNVEGLHFNIADNFPIIGYNNINTTESRNLGIAFQRYQSSNDSGIGEIVTDNYVFFDSIPNQSTCNITQIKFSNLTSSIDNYYTGWWIKIASGNNMNQVRKIISYNGAQRVAQIDTTWTNQNPIIGNTVYFYNSHFTSFYYNDSVKSYELVYNTRDLITKELTSYDYTDLHLKHLTLSDTTPSLNASTGSIYTLGGISISNTNDSTSCSQGGSFISLGGASIGKKLYVGDNICLGKISFDPSESLHINQTNSTFRLENDTFSYLDFVNRASQNRFGIFSDSVNNQFSLTSSISGTTPKNSKCALTISSNGYVGVNTTTNINSPLTIQSNSLISTNTDTGYIGLIASDTNINDSSSSARVLVYGNEAIGSSGNVFISSGTPGSIALCTNNDIQRLAIDKTGTVTISNTSITRSKTSGALIVSGGIGICSTQNSSSFSSGGALTVAGGASISKDIFVGGNLYISGNLNASGSVTSPDITFSNEINCTLTGYDNNNLLTISQEAIFSFAVWVTPNSASENCQIEFTLPGRDNVFERRTELMTSCIGYTDDDNIIPLFNILSIGVKGDNKGLLKFQSVSTGIHYFTLICRYTMS